MSVREVVGIVTRGSSGPTKVRTEKRAVIVSPLMLLVPMSVRVKSPLAE